MRYLIFLSALLLASPSAALAQSCCVIADNGTGTIDLPPNCLPDGFSGNLELVEGLPAGSAVDMEARLTDFSSTESAGGVLGGTIHEFTATIHLEVIGSGTLAAFQRSLTFPVSGELHAEPRTPGAAVQNVEATMFRLKGKLQNDFDFWLLEFEGGDVFGLDSPGEIEMVRQGGPGSDFEVTGFFDYNYRIQFEGAQESFFIEGFRGITLDLASGFELCPSGSATAVPAADTLFFASYPNPTPASTQLSFNIDQVTHVDVAIFDVRGRLVRALWRGPMEPGLRRLRWNGRSDSGDRVAAGVYSARLRTGETTRAVRLTILR